MAASLKFQGEQKAACKQRHPGNWCSARQHYRNPLCSKERTSQPFLCASSGTGYRHASQAKCTHLSKQPPAPTPMHQMPQIWPKNLDGQVNSRLYVVREAEPGWNTSDRSALYRPKGGKEALQEWKGSLQNQQPDTFVRAVKQVILMCMCTVL